MTTPAFTRLQRILDLEERQSYRNRSVIGGMRSMASRWSEDARSEGVEAARSAIHYVAPVGEKDDYVDRTMANIEPYLFAETALTA